jgi:multisubunit Na+/H+ antiporter MnhG subunit
MKAKGLAFYWALVLCATGIVIALVEFMQSDTFKYGMALGTDLASIVGRWFLKGLVILLFVWLAETTIANGVAKGIAKAKAAEIKKTEKEQIKGATP